MNCCTDVFFEKEPRIPNLTTLMRIILDAEARRAGQQVDTPTTQEEYKGPTVTAPIPGRAAYTRAAQQIPFSTVIEEF